MIGFLNFMVSFGLAFFVAVRSRGIQLKDYPELISVVWRYFKKYPMDFILPPARTRSFGQSRE
jgi:site-specific recombinase